MKHFAIILSIALVVFATSCKEAVKGDIEVVTPEEMQSLLELEDVQLVDVRTPEERKEGYIENSQNIDYNSPTFDEDILKLDKTKPVILYCKSGGRSSKCAEKLKDAGFVKIYDLKGGITQWKFEGLKIKTLN
ncbi:MAG: rhodanese-like domain-containing protein [Gelidibacter sp.]|nr:rhodanese-like domain-containing protein [Gelidibacter sp.]